MKRVPNGLKTEDVETLFQELWLTLMEISGRPPMKMQELGSNSSSNLTIKLDKLFTRAEMTSKIKFQNYFSNSAINQNKPSNLKNSPNLKNSICKQLSQIQ